jgi:hypothetical protein
VRKLAKEWIDNLDTTKATSYINHIKQYGVTFEKGDSHAEKVEEELNDDHDEDDYSA